MPYYIYKTDGSLLTEIVDSNIDQVATDLTLIGKNVTGYGEYINDNFVRLLENFSSTSEPSNPIVGQLWFDTSDSRLKVYDGTGFRIGSGPIVAGTPPLSPIQGDFWIDNNENVLYFYTGDGNRYSASKIWQDSQGQSGFNVTNLFDLNGNQKVVVKLFSGGTLLGIFSNNEEFTPATLIEGYTGPIKTGFNVANVDGFKFHARATTADALVDALGNIKTTDSFVFTDIDNSLYGTMSILNSNPLRLGSGNETLIFSSASNFAIRSNYIGQDFKIETLRQAGPPDDALIIKAATSRVGIFNNNPQATLDVNGDAIIAGNLTVNGSVTTINSTTLTIDDKNIVLASGNTLESFADGGGITLQASSNGSTDKSFTYHYDTNVADQHWTSSESINIRSGKSYKINGVVVLSANELASSITRAPGLTTIGPLNQLFAGNLIIGDPAPSGTYSNTIRSSNGPIVISPFNHLPIDVKGSRIISLQNPILPQDAVNLGTLESRVFKQWSTPINSIQYQAVSGDRLFIDTSAQQVSVILPDNPARGDSVRCFDYSGTWNGLGTSLLVKAYRKIDYTTLDGDIAVNGIFYNIFPTAVTGSGSGFKVNVTTSSNTGQYNITNTTITILSMGNNYADGDQLKIPGNLLGGASGGTGVGNDLVFTLRVEKILDNPGDLEVTTQHGSFTLIYANSTNGWQYLEQVTLPSLIEVDVKGNLISTATGNIVFDTSSVTALISGNLTGNVTGDLTGTVLSPSQPNITSLGTLTSLTVSSAINADLTGDVTGNLSGNVTGNVLGNVTGDVITTSITSTTGLTMSTATDKIEMTSGKHGFKLSAYDDTTTQEQYVMTITPGTASGLTSTTYLFGDVVVSNQTTSNVNGSSFRLPWYSTAQRDARSVTFLNYGELIYNTTLNKVQAYTSAGWVDIS